MKKKSKNNKKYKYNKKQFIISGILLIYICSLMAILGRYVTNNINNFFSKSKEFYFYSDKLTEEGAIYQIDNWSGVDDYTITINMNSFKNNLLFASYDIEYDIAYTCSNNIICQLSKTSGIIRVDDNNSDFFKLIITPNTSLQTGDTVTVQITTTARSTYQKILSGIFVLKVGQEKLTYEIVDSANSPYLSLNITNTIPFYKVSQAFDTYQVGNTISIPNYLLLSPENKAKCYSAWVTLTFEPEDVVLDMTNNAYLNSTQIVETIYNHYNYIKSVSFKIDAQSSQSVRFYKNDQTQDYTYPIVNNNSIITVNSI
ncbi:MAG: hypothetical protein Q4G09_02460 [Clostridia bacterium]|nr:hypothetical protein [Clostridia bacterium]